MLKPHLQAFQSVTIQPQTLVLQSQNRVSGSYVTLDISPSCCLGSVKFLYKPLVLSFLLSPSLDFYNNQNTKITMSFASRRVPYCSFKSLFNQKCINRYSSQNLLNFRRYATATNNTNSSNPDIPEWPTISYPTPYEIFHVTKANFDKKTIKKTFHKLAKLYHPDSASTDILNITTEVRNERFKKIAAAYDILKDDQKRKDYDLFNKGWEDSPRTRPNQNFYGRDFTKAARYSSNVHEGDAWADFHTDYRDREKYQDPEYQKYQAAQHRRVALYLLVGSLFVGFFQMFFLMDQAGGDIQRRNDHSQKAYHNVYLALTNYGFGNSREERISRFLAHRENGGMYDNSIDRKTGKSNITAFLPGSNTKFQSKTPSPFKPLEEQPAADTKCTAVVKTND